MVLLKKLRKSVSQAQKEPDVTLRGNLGCSWEYWREQLQDEENLLIAYKRGGIERRAIATTAGQYAGIQRWLVLAAAVNLHAISFERTAQGYLEPA
jgi:hypothetical protein